MRTLFVTVLVFWLGVGAAGCEWQVGPSPAPLVPPPYDPGAAAPADTTFLNAALWDDGQAEVAFYAAERQRDNYGRYLTQRFTVGTYVVKHAYSVPGEAKAVADTTGAVPAFKHALFYEFETTPGDGKGRYQYKRSYVTNTAQRDGRTLKSSLAVFDWCSNSYAEFVTTLGGQATYRFRSDDYGNQERRFDAPANAYPAAALPFLVRSLDFRQDTTTTFRVLLPDGNTVEAIATRMGRAPVSQADGTMDAEVVRVSYSRPVPSVIGEESDPVETYWRSTTPDRRILRLEAASGRYRLTLTEYTRVAYWAQDVFAAMGRTPVWP